MIGKKNIELKNYVINNFMIIPIFIPYRRELVITISEVNELINFDDHPYI